MGNRLDFLVVGRIVRPFGVRGEVKVLPMTDNAERFRDIRAVFLNRDGSFQREELEHVKVANNGVILKLENIGTRDEAEQLKDQLVYIDRNNAAPIDESSHYYCDIQGCTVRTLEGDVLGTVFDIQNAGSCDVYFVRPEGSRDGEILIPAIRDVVKKIDTEGKEILIDVIDGLL